MSTPVGTAAAAELGWTRSARRHAVAAGDLESLGRGVLRAAETAPLQTPERRRAEQYLLDAARASTIRCPRATISHFPAAIAWGIPTFGTLGRPCLTVAAGTALRTLADAHLHRATLQTTDVAIVGTDQVTTPARTVMDVAREHGVAAGVVAADYVLHQGLVDESMLAAAYEGCRGWPGRRRARITMLSADGAAESPLESVSRLRISAAGLPPPTPQVEICDVNGEYITRSDFYWDEFGVIGEADGDGKYDPDGETAERQRRTEQKLERIGLTVVRWSWADLFDFGPVTLRLRHAMEHGVRAGSPARRWGVLLPRRRPLHP